MAFAFPYREPPPDWPAWYREYRFGAFYLFPPPDVLQRVNEHRSRYDARSAASCEARVSLTVPLPRPLGDAAAAEVVVCAATHPAFSVEWGPP